MQIHAAQHSRHCKLIKMTGNTLTPQITEVSGWSLNGDPAWRCHDGLMGALQGPSSGPDTKASVNETRYWKLEGFTFAPTSWVFSLSDSGRWRWPAAPGLNFAWGRALCRRPAGNCKSASGVRCWWLWRAGWQEPRPQCQPRPGRRWSRTWCLSETG